jgi:hypothetical protein
MPGPPVTSASWLPKTMTRPFNLDEILGEKDVAHYLKFITPTQDNIFGREAPGVQSSHLGEIRYDDEQDAPGQHWRWRIDTPEDDIERRGFGAADCSSSFALATQPEFVWDVCEYYRLLGVTPWATRLELRKGFLARRGGTKPRLAYALKQLLNPFIRRMYDQAVPTQPFYLDKDTQEALKRKAILEAARESFLTGEEVTQEEVLARWGLKHNKPGEEQPDEELVPGRKLPEATSQPLGDESHSLGSTIGPWALRWSWYAWHQSAGSEYLHWDPKPLENWQRLIRAELSRRGLSMRFAVGLHQGYGWKLFRTSEGACIVFLARDEYPTEDLAAQAVDVIAAKGDRSHHANEKGRRPGQGLK